MTGGEVDLEKEGFYALVLCGLHDIGPIIQCKLWYREKKYGRIPYSLYTACMYMYDIRSREPLWGWTKRNYLQSIIYTYAYEAHLRAG